MYAQYFHPTGPSLDQKRLEIEQSIPARFESIANLYRHKSAIQTQASSISYDELNRYANRIGWYLVRQEGLRSEPVVLLLDNLIDIVAAMLGVLKAGKFFVVVDSSFPELKVRQIVNHCEARAIITNRSTESLAQQARGGASKLLDLSQVPAGTDAQNLRTKIRPEDFASILYTSGSTGEPKGVLDNHMSNLHLALLDDTGPEDRASLIHSVAFGSGRADVFYSILNGSTLCQFDLKNEGSERFAKWLGEERITVCHLPPSAFRSLGEVFTNSHPSPSLRKIRLSGAPVSQVEFDLYKKYFPRTTKLQINFGATETRRISAAVVDHDFVFPDEGVPVGYPAPWKNIRLVDDLGNDVAPGEPGEIVLRSRYLTCGYWKNAELNAKKFIAQPDAPGEFVYYTGDMGRTLPDGFMIHLGRKDLMVKIRGFRVEFNEVERALLGNPKIKEAAVTAWEKEPDERFLAAYLVSRDQAPIDVDELRSDLARRVSDYMIPSVFVFVESLPFLNGKLDRKALPKPAHTRPQVAQKYTAPSTAVEQDLVNIWEDVLSVHPVGVHDNFLDLGGNSLAASRITSRIMRHFQIDLPLQELFEAHTVTALASVVAKHRESNANEPNIEALLESIESMSEVEAERTVKTKPTQK